MKVINVDEDTGELLLDIDERETRLLIEQGVNQLLKDAINRECKPRVLLIGDSKSGNNAYMLPIGYNPNDDIDVEITDILAKWLSAQSYIGYSVDTNDAVATAIKHEVTWSVVSILEVPE